MNGVLSREDYPFIKHIQEVIITPDRTVEAAPGNSDAITASMGVFTPAGTCVIGDQGK